MRYIVPLKLVAIALDLARRVEQGELGRQAAYQQLVDQHGFAGHTANAYLNCYAHLRAGTPMKATVNAAGLELMLEEITKLGADELFKALQALHGHILYLEGLPNNTSTEHSLRRLLRAFTERLATGVEISPTSDDFEHRVQASIAGSKQERIRRLAEAARKPRTVLRVVRGHERNPDVVAEVLIRAQGACEVCGSPAPFTRKSNGSPYLEVHHVAQLAHGGDDTVENAIAVCPNCHRQQHYGVEGEPISTVAMGLAVLGTAATLSGDLAKAVAWYQSEPIADLGGQSAELLVAAGAGGQVLEYLRARPGGEH